MLSVGTDIVEIARVEKSLAQKGFLERVFGEEEITLLKGLSSVAAVRSAAANFCAKEAFSKALGTGIRGFSVKEVQLLRNKLGKPYFSLSGKAAELAEGMEMDVSVSHSDQYAVATVIIMTKGDTK